MKKVLLLAVSSRLLFLIFALLAVQFIPLDKGWIGQRVDPTVPYLAWIWANFDGEHFIKIARDGYSATNFAYFPVYPALIFLTQKVIPASSVYIGIGISLLAFFAAAFVIYKIARIDYSEKISKLSVIMFSFFPLSFFYQSVYTDSLFLLFSTLSFYFARKKNWILSGVFGGLVTLDRFSGIALVPALAYEWYLQNKDKLQREIHKLFTVSALTASGLLLYMLYLKIFYGDPLLFQKSMSAWGQDKIIFPLVVIPRYINILATVDRTTIVWWIALLEFVSFFLYLALSAFVWRFFRKSYAVFMGVLLILITFTGTLAGTPRYILHLFPAFIGLSLLAHRRPRLLVAVLFLFLILGFLLTGLFTRGYFVG